MDDEPTDPDPYIVSLNQDLSTAEEIMTHTLPTSKVRFVFDGLSILIAHMIISNFRYIKKVNENGIKKMILNLQALQQNLTNFALTFESIMDHVKDYYELFLLPLNVSVFFKN